MTKLPKSFTTVTPFTKALALSMLVIFPIIGFLLGIKYNESKVSSFTGNVSVNSGSWKVFKNDDFSFDYPEVLETKEFKNFGVSLWNRPAPNEIPMEAPFPPIHILVADSENIVKAYIGESKLIRTENVEIGKENAKMNVVIITGTYYTDHVIYYTTLKHNNKVYFFRLDLNQYNSAADFYQILSTFKFTN